MASIENENYNRELFSKIYDSLDKDEFYSIRQKQEDYYKEYIYNRWQSLFDDISFEMIYTLKHQAEVFGEGELGKAYDCNKALISLRKALDIIIEENEKIIREEARINEQSKL